MSSLRVACRYDTSHLRPGIARRWPGSSAGGSSRREGRLVAPGAGRSLFADCGRAAVVLAWRRRVAVHHRLVPGGVDEGSGWAQVVSAGRSAPYCGGLREHGWTRVDAHPVRGSPCSAPCAVSRCAAGVPTGSRLGGLGRRRMREQCVSAGRGRDKARPAGPGIRPSQTSPLAETRPGTGGGNRTRDEIALPLSYAGYTNGPDREVWAESWCMRSISHRCRIRV